MSWFSICASDVPARNSRPALLLLAQRPGRNLCRSDVAGRLLRHLATTLLASVAAQSAMSAMSAIGDVEIVSQLPENQGGVAPMMELTAGPDGTLFLPTQGAPNAPGDPIAKITLAGKRKVVHWFDNVAPGGEHFGAPLLLAKDGNFYGSTSSGASFGHGAFLRMAPSGRIKVLYEINPGNTEGDSRTDTRLLEGDDGNFYGGLNGSPNGHLFRLKPGGQFTVLHTFDREAEGDGPISVMQASDGFLYGTLAISGSKVGTCGALFRSDKKGRVTIIHNFDAANNSPGGCYPAERLLEGNDRRLYGRTTYGGTQGFYGGVAFRIDLDTLTFEKLHDFDPATEGSYGWDGFMLASDGDFYGTSTWGGINGYGTAFRMTSGGEVTVLHQFGPAGLIWPVAGLVQSSDGNLYGTAFNNELTASVVYRVRLVP